MQKLPDGIRLEEGQGGLKRLAIQTPQADAEIYLHGAHVMKFQPKGQKPVLWMSAKSMFEPGKPLRGGVPICFPWFGARQGGQPGSPHGFARLMEWELVSAEPANDGAVEIHLRLVSNNATRALWPGEFVADYRVRIGTSLYLGLSVKNTGSQPLRVEEALHTYFSVSDVKQVSIDGLAGVSYFTAVPTPRTETEGTAPIRITAETDRVYLNTQSTCVAHDPGWRRKLVVEKNRLERVRGLEPVDCQGQGDARFRRRRMAIHAVHRNLQRPRKRRHHRAGQSHAMGATIHAE